VNRWSELKETFWSLIDRDAAERAGELAAGASADPALYRQVEALLVADADGDLLQLIVESAPPFFPNPPTSFGPFDITGVLGVGGMGEVYRARDSRLQREVAIKVLPAAFAADRERLVRFEREAQLLASLNHPHIAQVHGLEDYEGRRVLVMELVEGPTLAERIATFPDAPIALSTALSIAAQIADGLAAAHQKGIIHRDLKPANIGLTSAGTVKILDFGVAKSTVIKTMAPATITAIDAGVILGTPAYMSPEQARAFPIDKRTDIWSFGCVLYELLCGRSPFADKSGPDTIAALLTRAPDMNALPANVPPALRSLLRHCLEKEPEHRLANIEEARITIEGLSRQPADAFAAQLSRTDNSQFAVSTRRRWPFAGSAAVILALSIAGYFAVTTLPWLEQSPEHAATVAVPAESPVTVSPFENRTGDAALDPVGRLVADAIAQEVPLLDFVQRSRQVTAPGQASRRGMVTGAYYIDSANLRIQASLVEPGGTILYSIEPAIGPRTDPGTVVELVRQRMLGAIVTYLDPFYVPGRFTRPPQYRAYREYLAGMDLFGSDNIGAKKHFERAIELDPDFFSARETLASVYYNTGNRVQMRETIQQMRSMRDRLSPVERLRLDWLIHASEDRHFDALRTLRESQKLDPDNLVTAFLTAVFAVRVHRPQEALDALAKVNDEFWDTLPIGWWRYSLMTEANHRLGRHEEELRIARLAKNLYPSSGLARGDEASALAALARFDDLHRAIDEGLVLATTNGSHEQFLLRTSSELLAHGHRDEAMRVAVRAVAWCRGRPPAEQASEDNRWALAQALYLSEQWAEAQQTVGELTTRQRKNVAYRGFAGSVAARLGDRDLALKHSAALVGLPAGSDGTVPLLRARISAILGDRQQAVAFVRDALAEGNGFGSLHRDRDLQLLRGFAPYEELLRPKG
jgi:serine/threonine protein kinase/tetratricopeptide (TPR) repeat protein